MSLDPDPQRTECLHTRARVHEFLTAMAWELVTESHVRGDGWRSEWLPRRDGDLAPLLVHKPSGAPFVTIECWWPCAVPTDTAEILALLDRASDYDIALYYDADDPPGCHLSARLPTVALSREAFEFSVMNLLQCREDVMGLSQGCV